jgi:transcriptional regulator of acetoin/glycerol metabolism
MRRPQEIVQHVGRVIDVVEHGLPLGRDSTFERLARSWRRSLSTHQVDPALATTPRVVTAQELREHRDRIDAFMRIAREGMDRLHAQLRPVNYCVLLTDADGVTVDFRTVPELDKEFKAEGFRVGTCWSETLEGTCGVGTALIDGQPMLVHRDEHFRSHNIAFSCSSVPIFGPDDRPVAVLDATALHAPAQRESQFLVYRLVLDRAQQIENAFAWYNLRPYWVLQLGRLAEYLSVQTDYLVAFDDSGRIVGGNRRARLELLDGDDGPAPAFIHDLFECTTNEILGAAHAQPGQAFPLRLVANGERLFAILRAPAPHSRGGLALPRAACDPAEDSACTIIPGFSHLALDDARLRGNVERALKVANRDIPVMLLGETGTGKEAFARAIHEYSDRRDKPFVALNCAAIPETLIESELFGYRDGAFTGARSKGVRGKILQSDGGTLFLDEIGDMPLQLQSRLLRVLAEGEVLPLGAETPIPVRLHVICATHQDLPELVQQGRFREDLYYRVNGAVFLLPPLRERDDIRGVIDKVMREEATTMDRASLRLAPATLDALARHDWPGNIRQLRHAMRYACAIADGDAVELEHLPPDLFRARPGSQARTRLDPFDDAQPPRLPYRTDAPPCALSNSDAELRAQMLAALRRHHWQVTVTARELGMSRATFYRKMARLQIVSPNRREFDA